MNFVGKKSPDLMNMYFAHGNIPCLFRLRRPDFLRPSSKKEVQTPPQVSNTNESL